MILALALLLRMWGMGFGLPQKVHPDEPLIADRAIEAVAKGNLNPGFFHWPSFIIYLLYFEYIGVLLVGRILGIYSNAGDIFQAYFSDPTFYFWVGRLTTSLFCLGGMLCLYAIGKKVGGRSAGLAAALLMGFNSIFVEYSRYITPDIAAVSLMIYVWYCLVDYLESGRLRMLFFGAFVGGVAVSTKYNAALLLVPILIAAASRVQHWPEGEIPALTQRIGVYLILCVVLFALGFFLFTPYSLLDSGEFMHQLRAQASHQLIGHVGMETGGSAFFAVASYFFNPYGLALLALTLCGLPRLAKPAVRGAVLLSYPFLYLIAIAGWVVWAERYLLFILPACFLAGGICLSHVGQLLMPRKKEIIAIGLAAVVTIPSLAIAVKKAHTLSLPDTRVVALHWIEENIPAGSRLFIEKGGPEPHHVDDVTEFGLNVWPTYYYTEPELWLSYESAGEEPLAKLRSLRPPAEYIVSSGYTHDRYFDPDTQAMHPELVKPWVEYYDFVETHGELVFEVIPDKKFSGPWIKIYRMPNGSLE